MRQLNLTESQIEILLRALANESTVDQDLDRRRVLTVPELIERRDSRLELKRILNASLKPSQDRTLLVKLKSRIQEISQRLDILSPKIDSGRFKYSEKQERDTLVSEYEIVEREINQLNKEYQNETA